jgi:hypothetical protein
MVIGKLADPATKFIVLAALAAIGAVLIALLLRARKAGGEAADMPKSAA